METRGSFLLTASPETLWPLLLEPHILAHIVPGGQAISRLNEKAYTGKVQVWMGPLAGAYDVQLSLSEVLPPVGFAFHFTAQSKNGRFQSHGRFHLQPQNGRTHLHYEAHTEIAGGLAQSATPLLESNARALVRQSLERLEQLLQNGTAESVASGAPAVSLIGSSTPSHRTLSLTLSLTLILLAALLLLILSRQKRRQQTD